jgi:hypothetical protein
MRIVDLGVHVVGSVPATGYTGTLVHHGTSYVRDAQGTLAADRLIPTDEELADAIANIGGSAAQGLMVGGVIPLVLDGDGIELSLNNEYNPLAKPEDVVLPVTLFQGYSPAAAWTIDIRGLSANQIADVYLRWTVVHEETDPDVLKPHVEELIARYEQDLTNGEHLDKLVSLSLGANQESDLWTDLENTAQTTFAFDPGLFPTTIRDLKVKAVVARALAKHGSSGEGIGLVITKPDASFDSGELTTLADGFTASLGDAQGKGSTVTVLDAASRFPLLGEWQVQLSDPTQFARLDDLQLFVMYEYTEV